MNREFLDTIYGYWYDNQKQISALEDQHARAKEGSADQQILINLLNTKQADRQRLDNLITLYCESFK